MPNYPNGPRPGGSTTFLEVTTSQALATTPITCNSIIVNSLSATIGIYDTNATTSASLANLIASIPSAQANQPEYGKPIVYNWACQTGLVAMFTGTGNLSIATSPLPSAVVT